MDELLAQFLVEGPELVQQAGEDLLALESAPNDSAILDSAFRAVHTLKGSVGLFDFAPMGSVLHAAEDLLGAMRAGRLKLARASIDVLIGTVGQVERWIEAIATSGALPEESASTARRLVERLRAAQSGDVPAAEAQESAAAPNVGWVAALRDTVPSGASAEPVRTAVRYVPDVASYFEGNDPIAIARDVPGVAAFRLSRRNSETIGEDYDPFACDLVIELLSSEPPAALRPIFRFVSDQVQIVECTTDARAAGEAPGEAGRMVRIPGGRVDALAEVVEELIAAKNGLADLAARAIDGLDRAALVEEFRDRQAMIDRLIGRLHRTTMAVRLLPMSPLLRRFPRLVREIAASVGKDVELSIEGQEIEADKSIIDGLFEPLTHLLRNAIDHGVEAPEERERLGKPSRASLTLSAERQGDRVAITLRDDGRGIDPAAIRRVAAERSIQAPGRLESLTDAEVIELLFLPGFSTARAVSEISGRGVGLDAVRTAVERLGGRVSLESQLGSGTVARLMLPLNLVLAKIIAATAGGERYGVPVETVIETARLSADSVVPVRAGFAVVLRDRVLPLVHLADLLHGSSAVRDAAELRLLVVRAGPHVVALAVDGFFAPIEILLRPMTGLLAGMPGIIGTTVAGDGRVMMVIDVEGLIG